MGLGTCEGERGDCQLERPTLSMQSGKVKGLLMCSHGCEPCDGSVRKVQLKCPGHREEDTALAQDSRACGPVGRTDVAGSNASCCCGLNAGLSLEVWVGSCGKVFQSNCYSTHETQAFAVLGREAACMSPDVDLQRSTE